MRRIFILPLCIMLIAVLDDVAVAFRGERVYVANHCGGHAWRPWGVVFALSLSAWVLGFSSAPLVWSFGSGVLLLSAIVAAWCKYGRGEFSLVTLCAAPLYVLSKLPLYFAFLVHRQTMWERAEREPQAPPTE